jgi:hypothetical protein
MSAVTPLIDRRGKLAGAACEVRDAMQPHRLYLICEQRRQVRWFLSNGELFPPDIVRLILTDPNVVATDDLLFPGFALSQTY